MGRAFDDKDFLRLWCDPDKAEHLAVSHLRNPRCDGHPHATDTQTGRGPKIQHRPAVIGADGFHFALRQHLDNGLDLDGAIVGQTGVPANAKDSARALPQLVGLGGGMRVYDQPDRRVLRVGIDQGPQHPRRGRHPTRTGVVLGIGNHHRPLPCPFRRAHRIGNRRVGGKCIIVELGFGSGIGIRHRICCGIRRRLSLGIGHRRGATIGNICRREAHEQRRRQCALRLNLCQVFIQSLGGLHIRRLKRDRHQIGHAAERFGRARAGLHHKIQQPRRCGTGIGHIDVRIGAKSCEHIHRVHKFF